MANEALDITKNLALFSEHWGRCRIGRIDSRRLEKNSVAIASNEWFSGWKKTFTGLRLCAAIVDRLTFGGHIIETGTQSCPAPSSECAELGAGTVSHCCGVAYLRMLMARAMTRAVVDRAMALCRAIRNLTPRVNGMVSVGEKAVALVKLT